MRDSFIFYRSFYEAAKTLGTRERLKLYDAVFEYALNDKEIELAGPSEGMLKLLKPQIDANNRKFENGKKGGRPKVTETKPNDNLNETKTKPKGNRPHSKTQPNVNVNVNDNVNVNVNDYHHNVNGVGSESGGGGDGCDDKYDLWKKLDSEDIDAIYDAYPKSGGELIEEVVSDVKAKRKTIKNARSYILGYAKRVGWSDDEDHFVAPWEA